MGLGTEQAASAQRFRDLSKNAEQRAAHPHDESAAVIQEPGAHGSVCPTGRRNPCGVVVGTQVLTRHCRRRREYRAMTANRSLMASPKLKLTYFGIQGKGEKIRLAFTIG